MLLDKLQWRYATKKMDPTRRVPDEKLARIIEAIRLAPSSSGLQPFKLLVVEDPDLRARLRAVASDQAQLTDGSHLLVFAAWDNYTKDRIDGVVDEMARQRGTNGEEVEGYYSRLRDNYLPRAAEVNFEHAARQAYIALGIALTAAAFEEVDSTPMEGFDNDRFDEILGLREQGLRSVVILPLGYRQEEEDWLVDLKKVRRPADEFVQRLG